MRSLALLIFGLWIAQAGALECKPPALLKQADGKDDTLQSWCEIDGVREGIFEVVSLKKGLEVRAHYKKGELDGQFQRFSENNAVTTEGRFAGGRMSGEWTRYWSNGQIRDRGEWKDDTPVGRWKYYDDKGQLEREGSYSNGQFTLNEKLIENLTSGDRWRLRFGIARTKLDHNGDTGGPAIGADRRLFRFGRWFRADLGLRLVPDRKPNGNNGPGQNSENVYSGQLAFSFDLFPNVTDPVVLYVRGGVHIVDFNKPRGMGGLGLRYHFTNKRQGWIPNGIFAELSGADGENDNNNNSGSGPGPGPGPSNSNNNQGGGHETLFAGALWAFF